MKDIFFYYRKKDSNNRELIEEINSKYAHAKIKLMSGSVFNFIDKCTKESKTDFLWVIELGTTGWEELISYNVETWDKSYLHIFESKTAKAYLVPRDITFDKKNKDFSDKKFIKTDVIKSLPYDVFFICYDENNAAKNLRYVKEKRPDVKVISGIEGIFKAHLEAAHQSSTEFFWVVDADATVIDAFDFEYKVNEYDFDVVHIWKSYNPINKLEYGHGGVKLLPKHILLNADEDATVDITTSLTDKIKVIDEISNINNFATNPFNTWRAAFRECVKLSSRIIKQQVDQESNERLLAWLYRGDDRPFAEYARAGASAGKWYGETFKDSKESLMKINNYLWLEKEFNEHIKLFDPISFKPDFNESEFNAWATSFKRVANLILDESKDTDTQVINMLNIHGVSFEEFKRLGSSAGKWFAETYKNDAEQLEKMNNIFWLLEEFKQHIKMFKPQEETKSEVNGKTEEITEAQAVAIS